jgi:hypothetical protein
VPFPTGDQIIEVVDHIDFENFWWDTSVPFGMHQVALQICIELYNNNFLFARMYEPILGSLGFFFAPFISNLTIFLSLSLNAVWVSNSGTCFVKLYLYFLRRKILDGYLCMYL